MSDGFRLPSPLYAIADTSQTAGRSLVEVVEEMLAARVRILQLRIKDLPANEFFHMARTVRSLTSHSGCLLIINDRIDIALAVNADGVHLGQEDLPITAARPLMGEKIIGVSTHSLEQAREAQAQGADYIGFGPLFGTSTKNTGYAPRGLAMLARVREAVELPIVAIGGISCDNAMSVWQHGADGAALISYLTGGRTTDRVTEILRLAETASSRMIR
jgi:thiamine-phosphate pyrophosphorylase